MTYTVACLLTRTEHMLAHARTSNIIPMQFCMLTPQSRRRINLFRVTTTKQVRKHALIVCWCINRNWTWYSPVWIEHAHEHTHTHKIKTFSSATVYSKFRLCEQAAHLLHCESCCIAMRRLIQTVCARFVRARSHWVRIMWAACMLTQLFCIGVIITSILSVIDLNIDMTAHIRLIIEKQFIINCVWHQFANVCQMTCVVVSRVTINAAYTYSLFWSV